ncbi:MAG: hypothetical protein KBA31_14645 [Alphaproteobacteria bacterium]|nr:hypothetical protein [Alphaproteobacteria bacterium]
MSKSEKRSVGQSLIATPLIAAVTTGAVLAANGTVLIGVAAGVAVGFAAGLIAVVLLRQVAGRKSSSS